MKRSEMLEILAHQLFLQNLSHFGTVTDVDYKQDAEYLLKAIESTGMYPPAYAKPILSAFAQPGDYTSCFEWEKEDEKK